MTPSSHNHRHRPDPDSAAPQTQIPSIPVLRLGDDPETGGSRPGEYWLWLAILSLPALLYGAFWLLPGAQNSAHSVPQECHYLSHVTLNAKYRLHRDGSSHCQSLVRHFGANSQHSIRYRATGRQGAIEEMRLSLRIGQEQRERGISQLLRYGQSLALPVLGHTMPAEVGQYLRQGRQGFWQYPDASLAIEHHHYPAPDTGEVTDEAATEAAIRRGHEDIELVFRIRPQE